MKAKIRKLLRNFLNIKQKNCGLKNFYFVSDNVGFLVGGCHQKYRPQPK